jgi:hypothetical protein
LACSLGFKAPEARSLSLFGRALALIGGMFTLIGEVLAMVGDGLTLVSSAVALIGHPFPTRHRSLSVLRGLVCTVIVRLAIGLPVVRVH